MKLKDVITGNSIGFDVGLAEYVGLHAAIVFSHIFHLRNQTTLENLQFACYGYMTRSEIKRSLKSLLENDFIVVDGIFYSIQSEAN